MNIDVDIDLDVDIDVDVDIDIDTDTATDIDIDIDIHKHVDTDTDIDTDTDTDIDTGIDTGIDTDTDIDTIIDIRHRYKTLTPGREIHHTDAASQALAPAVPAVAFCLEAAHPAPFPALCPYENVSIWVHGCVCVCVCVCACACVCVCVCMCVHNNNNMYIDDLILRTFERCNSCALSSAACSAFCHCSSSFCGFN